MSVSRAPFPAFEILLQRGHALENEGRFDEALAQYDHALAMLRVPPHSQDGAKVRALGLAWMNRGNALQKIGTPVSRGDAVRAYDEAIAVFRALPVEGDPALRNHFGAAWLNRGHALLPVSAPAAIESFEQAILQLEQLPLETDPYFRLNLAGAHTNLAHALLPSEEPNARNASDAARSAASARSALAVLAPVERAHEAFAAMSLRARRALVMALGILLMTAESTHQPTTTLASEATDVVDDGLVLARELEAHGLTHLRPLARRLFRLGAQLYGSHQPHFLGEFLLETLAPPAFAADAEFRAIADEAVTRALAHLQRAPLIGGSAAAERILETVQSLRAAQKQLETFDLTASA